jgi:hypothetical protein
MSIEQYKRITRIHKTLGNRQLNELLRFSAANPEMQDLHDVLVIVSSTGIRVGELCQLRWADIDFQLQELEVSNSGCSRRRIPFGSDSASDPKGSRSSPARVRVCARNLTKSTDQPCLAQAGIRLFEPWNCAGFIAHAARKLCPAAHQFGKGPGVCRADFRSGRSPRLVTTAALCSLKQAHQSTHSPSRNCHLVADPRPWPCRVSKLNKERTAEIVELWYIHAVCHN